MEEIERGTVDAEASLYKSAPEQRTLARSVRGIVHQVRQHGALATGNQSCRRSGDNRVTKRGHLFVSRERFTDALLFSKAAREPHQGVRAYRAIGRPSEPAIRVDGLGKVLGAELERFGRGEHSRMRGGSVRNARVIRERNALLLHDTVRTNQQKHASGRKDHALRSVRATQEVFPSRKAAVQLAGHERGGAIEPFAQPLGLERAVLLQHAPPEPPKREKRHSGDHHE